jgi:hypothetical protein
MVEEKIIWKSVVLIHMLNLIVSIVEGFFLTPIFVYCYYSVHSSFYRWASIVCSILSISEPLFVSTMGVMNEGNSLNLTQIMQKLPVLTTNDLTHDHVNFLFLSILLLSIPPFVVIYYKRKEHESFALLKPVIHTFTLLATIFLLLLKIVNNAAPAETFILFHIALGVYPLSLATMIGAYFVKLENTRQSKKKKPPKEKTQNALVEK